MKDNQPKYTEEQRIASEAMWNSHIALETSVQALTYLENKFGTVHYVVCDFRKEFVTKYEKDFKEKQHAFRESGGVESALKSLDSDEEISESTKRRIKDVIDAYCRIRTIDNSIPDDILDLMKDSAIATLNSCQLNYLQMIVERHFIPEVQNYYVAFLEGIKGMVVSADSQESAINELMKSIEVQLRLTMIKHEK